MRENDGDLHWVFSDHHGTGEMAVDAIWGEVVQRRMTVFGENREAAGEWPGERGFVDGTVDESTGLTQLGARAYNAALGRFISVDPLTNLVDAQTMNGYAYANNSPTTYWDGSGLSYCTPADGICLSGNRATVSYKKKNGSSGTQHWHYGSKHGWRQTSYTRYRPSSGGGYQTNRYTMASGGWSGWKTVAKPPVPKRPPVSYAKSPQEQAIDAAGWFSQAGDWASGAWDWTKDNWGTISQVAGWAAFGACVFVSAGSCLIAGGAVLAANVGMDAAIDGSVNWREHGWSALMLGMGGGAALGVGRLATGTWRGALSSMRSRPTVRTGTQRWDYNPRSGNPQRREGIFQGWDMSSGPVDWGASSANYAVNIASGSTFGGPVPYSNPFAGR
ncbi:RHS repeat-associated core domain-containing protein [Nocardiopsis dassonvillei]|uniref:RHS repeat-associated core domain-containing protein n=1 Tax=Nocardiopsis dassonvillei TaxID=2014 RepID=UPI00366C851A